MAGQDAAEKGISQKQARKEAAMADGAVQKPLRGWRLVGVLFSLALGLLLAVIETSITATALVTIGEYFGDSVTVTWVVLAYLLSYMGFAIIFTRLSDGIGRQAAVIVAYVLFAAFSLGGGLAQTLNQLIALRVLQGIGGSGLYSMLMVIGVEITPVQYWGALSGMIGTVLATGSVLGPILGGVITQKASWRWIYLFNAPAAGVGVAIMLVCWPMKDKEKSNSVSKLSWRSLAQVDWIGALLLLCGSVLLVFALQEGGSTAWAWDSPVIVATLTTSGWTWIGFFAWISYLSFAGEHKLRAIFPFQIALSRPVGPTIMMVLLSGFPYFVAIINLPQRFQVVNGDTPIMAGVHLLPLLCAMAFGSFVGGAASSRKNFTSPTIIVATSLILLSCGLMSSLDTGRDFYTPTYGYELILGLGVGLTFSSGTLLTNLASKAEDVAAAQGALSQARILGGSIGLSMATILLNQKLSSGLQGVLPDAQIKQLEQSLNTIKQLSPQNQGLVAEQYAKAFNDQMRVCMYVSIFSLLFALWTYQRHPASVQKMKEKQDAMADESSDESTEMGSILKDSISPPQEASYARRPDMPWRLQSDMSVGAPLRPQSVVRAARPQSGFSWHLHSNRNSAFG